MTSSTGPAQDAADRSWIAVVLPSAADRPLGGGVVIDESRILTCAHVVRNREPADLKVSFPMSEDAAFDPPLPVKEVILADHPQADAAIIVLDGKLPPDVTPAPLRRPRGLDLTETGWWAYGFADGIGNDASGQVGAALAYGWVRIDTESRFDVTKGFSGGGLWSERYQAVVALVGQAHDTGDGRAFTLAAVTKALPNEDLSALTDGGAVEAAGADATLAWGWTLATDQEGRRHWRPRARGVTYDSESGHRFRGRTAALTRITGWLTSPAPDRQVLVVTGSPGVGKSTVLARIVTTADPGIAAELPSDDVAVRAPLGSIACAVHAKGKTALEIGQEIARAASAAVPDDLDLAVPQIHEAMTDQGGRRFTVVVDALDEATSPSQARLVIHKLLVPLAETCADVGARVMVGTRRRDDDGDLLATFGPAGQILDLDDDAYFTRQDLADYAQATLQLQGDARLEGPYTSDSVAVPIALRIAEVAERNFLVAGLIARNHGLHDRVAVTPEAIRAIPTDHDPVAVALTAYLDRLPPVAPDLTAPDVLTVLAFAEAPGFDLHLWAEATRAVTGHDVTAQQLRTFAQGAAANFLVDSGAQGQFRLFHQALNETLLARRLRHRPAAEDHLALTRAFIALGTRSGWRSLPPYLRRSLPHHADQAGAVDLVLSEPAFLLEADLLRLIPLAARAQTPDGRRRTRILRLTPRAAGVDAPTRLALFSTVETLHDLGRDFTRLDQPAPYRARWASYPPETAVTTLEGHTDSVNAVCTIEAGPLTLLASGGHDGVIQLWDPATGHLTTTLKGHTGAVNGVAQVRLGGRNLLASASVDETVRLWDPESGHPVTKLEGHIDEVHSVCQVQVDDRFLLASAGADGSVRLWDLGTARPTAVLEGHAGEVKGLCQIQVDKRLLLASAGSDGTVRLWDPGSGELVTTFEIDTFKVNGVCQIRVGDEVRLAASSINGVVRLLDPGTGRLTALLDRHAGGVTGMCQFEFKGQFLLATVGNDEMVFLWDPTTGQLMATLEGHTDGVIGICQVLVGDQPLLASAGGDGTVRLWDPAGGDSQASSEGPMGWVHTICEWQVGDTTDLAAAGGDGTVRLYDSADGRSTVIQDEPLSWVADVCQVHVGQRTLLVTGRDLGAVDLWDPVNGDLVSTLEGHTQGANGVCRVQTETADRLASASRDRTVRLWDLTTNRPVATWVGHLLAVSAVCQVQVAGRTLVASAGRDRTVRVWDATTTQPVATLEGHTAAVNAVSQIGVGEDTLLASASSDQTVRLWNPITGRLVAILEGHTSEVTKVCQVQTGTRVLLAAGGTGGSVRLWDPATQTLHTVIRTPGPVLALAPVAGSGLAIGLEKGLLVVDL